MDLSLEPLAKVSLEIQIVTLVKKGIIMKFFKSGAFASILLGIMLLGSSLAASHSTEHKKGLFLQGRGKNLANPSNPAEVKCRVFNEKGEDIGYVYSILDYGPGVEFHTFVLKCGTFEQVIEHDIALGIPHDIDDAAVAAIPEAAPYQNVPGAILLFVESDQTKKSPFVVSWKGTGVFKGLNKFYPRCVFIVVDGRVVECVKCSWNFNP